MLLKPLPFQAQATASRRPVDRSGYGAARADGFSQSNEKVTPEIALTVPAVLAAFTILCEDIASLPLVLYQREADNDRSRAITHASYSLMHDAPNPEMSSMVFRELKMGHLLSWGNFFAQSILDQRGTIVELWPLRPDRMTVLRVDGEKVYHYVSTDDKPYTFLRDEILHIPAFGFDGLIGYSRIALARNAIGLALATEKYGSKFFANDARPGFVLKTPNTLSDTAYDRLNKDWDIIHQGSANAGKKAILEEGLDIGEIGFPPEDAQFIETQKWTVAQLARVFRVPPHMIGDVEKSTSWGTGIDSQEQGYVNHTLRPWTIRIEQALGLQLLLPNERRQYYWEHLFDALVRGDLQTRFETYVKAINNGIFAPNDALRKENMPTYPEGNQHWRPANMAPMESGQANPAPAQANAHPLFLDAAQRVLRREAGEVRDARQRWNTKGKGEKYAAWVGEFYKNEFPVFAAAVFHPLVEAQLITANQVEAAVRQFCEGRGELALEGADLPEYPASQFLEILMEAP
jgi:HK97 family phage portal protein